MRTCELVEKVDLMHFVMMKKKMFPLVSLVRDLTRPRRSPWEVKMMNNLLLLSRWNT
jgi:hypothetical protein